MKEKRGKVAKMVLIPWQALKIDAWRHHTRTSKAGAYLAKPKLFLFKRQHRRLQTPLSSLLGRDTTTGMSAWEQTTADDRVSAAGDLFHVRVGLGCHQVIASMCELNEFDIRIADDQLDVRIRGREVDVRIGCDRFHVGITHDQCCVLDMIGLMSEAEARCQNDRRLCQNRSQPYQTQKGVNFQ